VLASQRGDEATDGVLFCHDVADIISSNVAPPARSSSPTTVAIRVPSRCLGAGAVSVPVASLVAFGLAGALGAVVRAGLAWLASLSQSSPSGRRFWGAKQGQVFLFQKDLAWKRV
jgi:hypothetical protein